MITSRALAALPKLLDYAKPFCKKETRLILPKGENWSLENDEALMKWLYNYEVYNSDTSDVGKILRISVFKGADEPFVMEMPKYRIPNWNLVWFSIYTKAKMYLKKAGTFILAATILIWFASTFPLQKDLQESYTQKINDPFSC